MKNMLVIRRLLLLILLFPSLSFADKAEDIGLLKEGIALTSSGDYEKAVVNLSKAREKLPVVGDYASLYISKAHMLAGRYEDCISASRAMISAYPDSRLRREALESEITCSLTIKRESEYLPLIENYVKEFPSDTSSKYLLSYLIKQKEPERAHGILLEIYSSAGEFSGRASKELSPSDITSDALLKRGLNLLKIYSYKEAESTLREARKKDDGKLKKEILSALASSLFGQKRYGESAPLFLEAESFYNAARSYVRAGDLVAFKSTLDRMLDSGDSNAGKILIAYALEKRSEKEFEEALKLLSRAKEKFPSFSEEAMWNTAWLYYMNGDYRNALSVLSELADTYKSNKYLYWKARAIEKTGEDALSVYRGITDEDYYGILSRAKTPSASPVGAQSRDKHSPSPIERIDILIEAGLSLEAASELIYMSQRTNDEKKLLDIVHKLTDMGLYRDAILNARKIPEGMRPDNLLYPSAYWPVTERISQRYNLDPHLVISLMREESLFDPMAYSPAGASGLMQLMPETASQTARKLFKTTTSYDDIYRIETNIELGAGHLSSLVKETGSVFYAIAAYNAGKHNVEKWLKSCRCESPDEFIEDIPYRETKNYVKRIITTYYKYQKYNGNTDNRSNPIF